MQAHAIRRHLMTWSGLDVVPLATPGEREREKSHEPGRRDIPSPASSPLPLPVFVCPRGGEEVGEGLVQASFLVLGLDSSGTDTEELKS